MKKIFTLCLAFFASISLFAQQQFATLSHNDTITAFYGVSALQQAHAAAVHGDIITLSSGTFNSVDITKLITIRGNGMEEDTIAGTSPTIIYGSPIITIPIDSVYQLKIDGMKLSSGIRYHELSSAQLSHCYFSGVTRYGTTSFCKDMQFINCVIAYADMSDFWQGGYNGNRTENNHFVNCVILQLGGTDFRDNSGNSLIHNCQLTNCIAKVENWHLAYSYQNIPAYTCTNCILFDAVVNDDWFSTLNNTMYCYNCIGINTSSTIDTFFFNSNHNAHNFSGMESVFKYFAGSYMDGMNFELQDSIATNILGNDGTEIGVYGGMVPYTPRVNTPRFVRSNVAPHTTLDGKLSVDIEVVSE